LEQVNANNAKYGYNRLPDQATTSFLALVMNQFNDRLVQVMLAVAILSGVMAYFEKNVHAYTEPAVIGGVLLLNAIVGALQSQSAESSVEALKKLQPTTACVLRDGEWVNSLPAAELVPGDVIRLRVGDRVPADARVIELRSNAFSTDEGSLTGESATVSKSSDAVDVSASLAEKTSMVGEPILIAHAGISEGIDVSYHVADAVYKYCRRCSEEQWSRVAAASRW
jgi:Ca2+-transporting ATPase